MDATARKRPIRQLNPEYVMETTYLAEVPKSRRQVEIDWKDWEERREPRAFGPPGRRATR